MAEEEEDIISTLPDVLLCHILSFLQTKQAVATTILSKRWNNLCLSVPSLYFKTTITTIDQNFRFNDNVYTVLLSRHSAVKGFRLKLIYDYPQILYLRGPINSIFKWLNYVVQRGVECLDLRLRITFWEAENLVLNLPISILTCKTLVVLKLCSYGVQQGSSSVLLPSLKTLHLKLVWFPKLRDLMLFLTGCPILQDLYTYDLYFDSEESLTCNEWKSFCLSNLTRADIDCFHSHLTLEAVQNVSSLRFEIDQVYSHNGFIPTFHNLTQLELLHLNYSWGFLLEVLKHCPMLQKLELHEVC
ncbi:F-box/LRR-repeat protein [Trifolium medium]|uniref:F-box/LRR-repeat protein n=1 Tax=Trifolium medium TaxID=97028 RepID=A0A392MKE9_9FABA|nr:F-box/LRR-repeat protein [Trifolium medium]